MTRSLFFIPGNQLYAPSHLRRYRDTPLLMVEDESICRRRAYHQQKLGLVIAAMREHAEQLIRAGFEVHYFRFDAARKRLKAQRPLAAATDLRKAAVYLRVEAARTEGPTRDALLASAESLPEELQRARAESDRYEDRLVRAASQVLAEAALSAAFLGVRFEGVFFGLTAPIFSPCVKLK